MIIREFKFDLGEVGESGQFWGTAAVYNNVDLGGDIIRYGAFSKTIRENNGKVPLLLEHRIPLGLADLEDSAEGLKNHSIINMEKEVGRDAHSDLKFYKKNGRPYGMSIGYDPVVKSKEGDFRVLKEVKLYEVSITLNPMNPLARVGDVKRQNGDIWEWMAALREAKAADPVKFAEIVAEFSQLFTLPAPERTSEEAAPKSEELEAVEQKGIEPEAFHSLLNGFHDAVASAFRA